MKQLFFILFLILSVSVFSAEKKTVQYDSLGVDTVIKASAEKEKEVFADKDFQYHEEAKESQNWFRAFFEWLINKVFGKMSVKGTEAAWQIVKWTFIAMFVGGVIFILLKSKFRGLFRGDSKKLAGASFADLPEDIASINLDKLIEEALQNGNYRLAVRWCFLRSLQMLNQAGKITWQPSKTNIDYELELQDLTQREHFNKLSYVFEHVWYGEVQTGEKLFSNFKNEIEKFNSYLHV